MKRKIFLSALMIMIFMCFFALGVNAAEVPEWTEIKEVEGMADKSVFGADGTIGASSRVLMSDGITYPAYYICKNSASLSITFTDINAKTGKSYAAVDVIRIEVPSGVTSSPMSIFKTENGYTSLKTAAFPEGFTKLSGYTFKATADKPSALVFVTLPSTLTSVGLCEFIDCTSLEELVLPDGITNIPEDFAKNTTALKTLVLPASIKTIGTTAFRSSNLSNGVVIPQGCTTIGNYAFKGTKVTSVTLPSTLETLGQAIFTECHSLTHIYSKSPVIGTQMFYDCDEISVIILENTVTINNQAFNNPDGGILKITSLVLPEGLVSVGNYAFSRSQITELVLPSTLTTVGESVFQGSKTLQKLVVLNSVLGRYMFKDCSALNELVLTEKFTTLTSGALDNVSQASFITYYTGKDYQRIATACSATTRFSQAKYYLYDDYSNGNYTYNKFMVIYDVNLCVAAFDGLHTEPKDDGDCTTEVICSVCSAYTYKEAKEHISSERIVYSSFDESGVHYVGCTNDGCANGTTYVVDALFICLGYSAQENGGGIAIGYIVNTESLERYVRVSGNTLKYGVFAALQSKLGDNDIFDQSGTFRTDVMGVEILRHDFNAFDLKVIGFTEEIMDTKLVVGAYVSVSDGEKTEYSYIQDDTKGEFCGKYYYASYNDILEVDSKN